MAVVIFGLSFQREATDLPPHRHDRLATDALAWTIPQMTSIFNVAFRATFSDVRTFEPPPGIIATSIGNVRVRGCQTFRTAPMDVRGQGTADFLLVVVLELVVNDADAATAWSRVRTVEQKISLLDTCGLGAVVGSYSPAPGSLIGQNSIVLPGTATSESETVGSVFAFYFMAWVSCLRIERAQLTTDLSNNFRAALSASSWEIANQRLAILNVQRFSMTLDRSNDPALKDLCLALTAKFKIDSRYDRILGIHRDFEYHLDNISKIIQSQQLGSVSSLLLILTLLSVPISLFGALIALNLQSEVFTSPVRLLFDARVYVLFAAGFLVALAPFTILKLFDRWRDRGRFRSGSRS